MAKDLKLCCTAGEVQVKDEDADYWYSKFPTVWKEKNKQKSQGIKEIIYVYLKKSLSFTQMSDFEKVGKLHKTQ